MRREKNEKSETAKSNHYPVTITTYNYSKEPVDITFEKEPEKVLADPYILGISSGASLGAIFLIWADVLSRSIIQNAELPIGILISMIGGPCFIWMMIKNTYGFGGNR